MSANNNIKSWKQWIDYLRSRISGKERNAFERELERDEFSREAAEGFRNFDPELLEKDLIVLDRRLKRRVRSSQKKFLLRMAASIAILFALGFAWIAIFDTRVPDFFSDRTVTQNLEEREKLDEEASSIEKLTDEDESFDSVETQVGISDLQEVLPPVQATKKQKVKSGDSAFVEPLPAQDLPGTENESAEIKEYEFRISAEEEERSESEVTLAEPPAGLVTQPETKIRAMESLGTSHKAQRTLSGVDIRDTPVSAYDHSMIQGRVISSEDKRPVPGASVLISGTSRGTVTDMEGQFTLEVDDTGEVSLTTRFIGMNDQTLTTSSGSSIEIQLEPDVSSLDEVVIIGYGSSRKSDATGAIETVNTEDMNQGSGYVEPLPEGGYVEFRNYITENLIYPKGHEDKNREVVVLRFTISDKARPENIVVLRSPGPDFSDEAIRLLDEGPDWKRAGMNGSEIPDVSVKVRIVFLGD